MTTRQQGKIGRAELFSLALAICLSGFILFGWAEKQYQQQAWLYWGVACCFGLVFWLVLWGWAHIFAGQSFAEALCYAFGRGGGRVLLLLYAVFWLLLPAGSTVCAVLFWQRLGGETASFALYAALFLLSSACFAATGAIALARTALLVVAPALMLTLANLGLTVSGADIGNLLPLTLPQWDILPKAALGGVLVFGNLGVLLPYLTHTAEVKNRVGTLFDAGVAAALLWLAYILGSLAVLGASLPLYRFPILQVFRLAEVGHWLSRFEVIGATLLLVVLLLRAAAYFTAAAEVLRYLIPRGVKYQPWLLAGGLWLILLELSRLLAGAEQILPLWSSILPWAMLVGSLLIPAAALAPAVIRLKIKSRTVLVHRPEMRTE